MTSREEFEKETGIDIKKHIQFYKNEVKGTSLLLVEYIEWFEKRNEYYQAYINYLLGAVDKVSFMDYCKSISMEPITIDELRNMITPPGEAKRGRG